VILHGLAVTLALAFTSTILLAYWMRPVDEQAVRWLARLRTAHAVAACALAPVAAFTTGPRVGAALLLGAYFLGRILKTVLEAQRGGVTASALIISCAIFAVAAAGILAGLRSLW
jgi:hypothetical protein